MTQFFDPAKLLLINVFSSETIPFNIITALAGFVSILITAVVVAYLIIRFKNYASKKQRSLMMEDYLDDLIKKIQNFKHRWNWGIPFWSSGYKRQIVKRVISSKKIRNHAIEIRVAARTLKEHLPKTNNKIIAVLGSLDTTIDGIVDFSSELEESFDILNVNDIPNVKLKELVSTGEDIRKQISQHLDSLEKLRGTLSQIQSCDPSSEKQIILPENSFTDITTPPEIEVGTFANVSATYHGSLKDGFLTCKIQDYTGDFNYCENKTTVRNLGQGRQIGILNFKNEIHSYKWAIQPKISLKKGKGKITILAYETKDYFENGRWIEHRTEAALEVDDVLLS